MSNPRERVLSFTPIETLPLPRPLQRFGSAFPKALAATFATAYAPERGLVLDPLAFPWSAADAAEHVGRRGIARSREPLGAWARDVVRMAPAADELLIALECVADSALIGTPHRVAMRELYGSRCATCRAPVVVEAFLWERDSPVPSKKAFRCGVCARDGRALLIEPVDTEDEELTRRIEPRGMAYWQLVERFGPDPVAAALGESVAMLYTPRNVTALMATLRAIETAVVGMPEAQAVLKLCLLESIVAGSRLNAVAGHGTPLRIDKGRARRGHASQTREVNIWLEYESTARPRRAAGSCSTRATRTSFCAKRRWRTPSAVGARSRARCCSARRRCVRWTPARAGSRRASGSSARCAPPSSRRIASRVPKPRRSCTCRRRTRRRSPRASSPARAAAIAF